MLENTWLNAWLRGRESDMEPCYFWQSCRLSGTEVHKNLQPTQTLTARRLYLLFFLNARQGPQRYSCSLRLTE